MACTLVYGQEQEPDFAVSNDLGMVASNHPLATLAGVEVLVDGGNAVDAAIASAATLGVVEPYSSGLGGDGFMLIRDAETGDVHALNFTGRAPQESDPADFPNGLPTRGPQSATIPGAAAGWDQAHRRFGRVAREVVLSPAIQRATEGYPLSSYGAQAQGWAAAQFLEWDARGARTWWGDDLQPPAAGDRITNRPLAETYESLAEQGFASFYEGAVAEEIVQAVRADGGTFTLEDLRGYEATWEEPIAVGYRDHGVHVPPPNSSGGLAIAQILQILATFDTNTLSRSDTDLVHLLLESVKLAAADRQEWSGDPAFAQPGIPLDRLTSKSYASEQAARIDPDRAATDVTAGVEQGGTSHISIVDREGNVVSMTVSLGFGWGSGYVAGDTGIVLNNGMQMFNTDPDSPAYLEAGKRGRWNMAPVLVTKEGVPWLALGTPGGTAIWQVVPQILVRLIDGGLPLQDAISAPRVAWTLDGSRVNVESAFPDDVLAELEGRGHELQPLGDMSLSMGGVAAVMIDPQSGQLVGGSDPRRKGIHVGW